jgi:hypothetical protein
MSGQTFFKQKIFFKRPQPFSPDIPKRMKREQIQKTKEWNKLTVQQKETKRKIEE